MRERGKERQGERGKNRMWSQFVNVSKSSNFLRHYRMLLQSDFSCLPPNNKILGKQQSLDIQRRWDNDLKEKQENRRDDKG